MSAATARRGRRKSGRTPDAARLLAVAEEARHNAHAPYSRFRVGAALLGRSGRLYLGCNVENASYGLSNCAERTALFKAVSEGESEYAAIAVTAGPGLSASPCGACRQVLFEFAPRMWVIWRDARGRILRKRVEDLLAHGFRFEGRKRR